MRRRQVLNGIAAAGAVGLGAAGSATGRNFEATPDALDELRRERGGTVVERVRNPSQDDIDRLMADSGEADQLLTGQNCCVVECIANCCTDCCAFGCRNCEECADGSLECDCST